MKWFGVMYNDGFSSLSNIYPQLLTIIMIGLPWTIHIYPEIRPDISSLYLISVSPSPFSSSKSDISRRFPPKFCMNSHPRASLVFIKYLSDTVI